MGHTHKQVTVMVKAEVDEGIVPAVRFLNELPGVWTHSSCQGTLEGDGPEPYSPYVQISWEDEDCLRPVKAYFQVVPMSEGSHHGYAYPTSEFLEKTP